MPNVFLLIPAVLLAVVNWPPKGPDMLPHLAKWVGVMLVI